MCVTIAIPFFATSTTTNSAASATMIDVTAMHGFVATAYTSFASNVKTADVVDTNVAESPIVHVSI